MNERLYLLISGSVFALMGFLHLIRIISQWSVQVGDLGIPFWLSGLAIMVTWVLSIWAAQLLRSSTSASQGV